MHLIYRRSRDEMPARSEEIHHAEEEGIVFDLLANPTQIIGDEPMAGSRRSRSSTWSWVNPTPADAGAPCPLRAPRGVSRVDVVIVSVGTNANPLLTKSTSGLDLTKRGNIVADEHTLATSKEGVFAGGDIVTGAATVILAMGAGKTGARSIDRYLQGQPLLKGGRSWMELCPRATGALRSARPRVGVGTEASPPAPPGLPAQAPTSRRDGRDADPAGHALPLMGLAALSLLT